MIFKKLSLLLLISFFGMAVVLTGCKFTDKIFNKEQNIQPAVDSLISREDAISQLLAKRYGLEEQDIEINFSHQTEIHARGKFKLNKNDEDDRMFFAIREDGEWQLVYDGSEAIPCETIGQYSFPSIMIEDCIDTMLAE